MAARRFFCRPLGVNLGLSAGRAALVEGVESETSLGGDCHGMSKQSSKSMAAPMNSSTSNSKWTTISIVSRAERESNHDTPSLTNGNSLASKGGIEHVTRIHFGSHLSQNGYGYVYIYIDIYIYTLYRNHVKSIQTYIILSFPNIVTFIS